MPGGILLIGGYASDLPQSWVYDKAESGSAGSLVYVTTEMGVRPSWALGFIVSFLSFLGFLAAVMWMVMIGTGR